MCRNMSKHFFYTLLISFLFPYQLVYGQYQSDINKKPAQFSTSWLQQQSKKTSENPSFVVKKRESGERVSPDNPISKRDFTKGENSAGTETDSDYKEDELFIKFKSAIIDNIHTSNQAGDKPSITLDRLQSVIELAKVHRLKKLSLNKRFKNINRTYKAAIEKGMALEKAIEILQRSPDIEYVEKVPKYQTLQAPNDPFYVDDNLYALNLVHAIDAFGLQSNANEVFVAIVDDAFLYDHPDLVDNVDPSKCYDVADGDADSRPPSSGANKAGPLTFSHGTHVGGIAGAVANNGLGIASVSNNKIKLFGIKATRDDTSEPRDIENGYEGVVKAIENGANVINMSFGGAGNSESWQELINDATAQGVIFVAAAGNGNTSVKNYPAAYDNVIAVSNTDNADRKNSSSHFGDWVAVAAPGTDILSTVVGEDGTSGSYASYSGTSMSSPMVAGLVGLLLSQNNTLTYNQVVSILQATSDNIDARNPGFEAKLGAGRINAYNAMLEVAGVDIIPEAEFISSDPNIFVGQAINFSSQSLGKDLTYTWTFEGGSPSVGTGKSVAVTYNTEGVYNVSLTVTNNSGTDIISSDDYVAVVLPQDCAILTYPFPGTRSFYSYVDEDTDEDDGPVIGQNINGFTQFANVYDYLPGNYISGGLFAIGLLKSNTPEKAIVRFKVWEESAISNIPGKVLTSMDVKYSDLKVTPSNQSKTNRPSYSEIIFDNPPPIPPDGRFYMGFEIFYEEGDSIGFYTNEDGDGGGNESFTVYEGSWVSFSEFDFNAKIEMSPVLVGGRYLNVNAFVAEAGACVGNNVSFNTDAIQQNVSAYEWTFEGGTPSTSTEANPVVTFNNQGEFEAKLLVTLEGCEEARRKFTQVINIVDCEILPDAEFTADRLGIEEGDSVQFFENSKNATGYSWVFEGGVPNTSEIANPYITYPDPGIYKVRLEVQNPLGNVSSLVKEEYIQVYEKGYCNFYLESKISNFDPSNSQTLYTSENEGYITGTGSGDLAKVEYFNIPRSSYVDKLEIGFGIASTQNNEATVEVAIFDNTGFDSDGIPGAPGQIAATKTIKISEISANVSNDEFTAVVFDDPVFVEGPFYAGVLLNHANTTDTVAIYSTEDDEVINGTVWELLSTNDWVQTNDRWSTSGGDNPLDIALHITAFLRQENEDMTVECHPLGTEDEVSASQQVRVYPNPFNSSTTIEYHVELPADVKLEIFNSLGQRVDALENSFKGKGLHEAIFNARRLPKGLYIYKLQIGDENIQNGRIILN